MTRATPCPPLLQVRGLRFGYPGVPLFDALDASIPAALTLVGGGDGRGKTTLLKLLAGELPPQAGHLAIAGVALAEDPDGYRRRVFRPDMTSHAFDDRTPAQVFDAVRARWPGFDDARVAALVDALALGPHMAKTLSMLSTGSKRKVWLAAAFSARAPVTLLDDPFGALDRPSVACVLECLREAAADPSRAMVFSGWEAPAGLPLAAVIDLGD
jgi:ABC-type multidrug transport system ATPase subunit